jgi:hypothetical protein
VRREWEWEWESAADVEGGQASNAGLVDDAVAAVWGEQRVRRMLLAAGAGLVLGDGTRLGSGAVVRREAMQGKDCSAGTRQSVS